MPYMCRLWIPRFNYYVHLRNTQTALPASWKSVLIMSCIWNRRQVGADCNELDILKPLSYLALELAPSAAAIFISLPNKKHFRLRWIPCVTTLRSSKDAMFFYLIFTSVLLPIPNANSATGQSS